MKLLNDRLESNASTPKNPLDRSPRQCMAPENFKPRKVCVVMGPFIGWKTLIAPVPLIAPGKLNNTFPSVIEALSPKLMGIGFAVTALSGFPRSHARSSMSPKAWQLAHEASPFPEHFPPPYTDRPP